MKIYNITQANYQPQTNNKKPSFGAKMKLDLNTQLIHDLEKLDLDYGIKGFLTGKPFKTLMNKFTRMFPDQTVEFTYQKPIFYGFNYIKGDGFAQSDAAIRATNLTTRKVETISIPKSNEYPFYELVSSILKNSSFWTK